MIYIFSDRISVKSDRNHVTLCLVLYVFSCTIHIFTCFITCNKYLSCLYMHGILVICSDELNYFFLSHALSISTLTLFLQINLSTTVHDSILFSYPSLQSRRWPPLINSHLGMRVLLVYSYPTDFSGLSGKIILSSGTRRYD